MLLCPFFGSVLKPVKMVLSPALWAARRWAAMVNIAQCQKSFVKTPSSPLYRRDVIMTFLALVRKARVCLKWFTVRYVDQIYSRLKSHFGRNFPSYRDAVISNLPIWVLKLQTSHFNLLSLKWKESEMLVFSWTRKSPWLPVGLPLLLKNLVVFALSFIWPDWLLYKFDLKIFDAFYFILIYTVNFHIIPSLWLLFFLFHLHY